ncbi:Rf4p protein [Monosporozyma servazzii]
MCMSVYCADFENFIKYYNTSELINIKIEFEREEFEEFKEKYLESEAELEELFVYENLGGNYYENKLNNLHLLTYILAYTCRHNFIFAYQLRHSGLELNELIYEAISANFIQHGYLYDYFIKVYKPLCIWYPKHPSKEACLKLLRIHDFYKYSVAYLSVIMGWEDIFIKSNIDCGFNDLHMFSKLFYRVDIQKRLEKYSIILDNVFSKIPIHNKYFTIDHFTWQNFCDFQIFRIKNEVLNDDLFVDFFFRIDFNFRTANVANVTDLGLNYKIFINNIQLSMDKKLSFNFSNKYVAYIGDIQYYKGGDFEYAKWGALNNSIFANYVINNKHEFPDFVIRNAVSNMLINSVIDDKLVYKYKPFYFHNFNNVYSFKYSEMLIIKFPFLKVNILFSYVNSLVIVYKEKYFNIADIDIIRLMMSNNNLTYKLNDLIKQAKEQGFYYKHLDFENECNYDEPKKIPFDSINLDDLKNQPLAVFQEGLSFTDFTPLNH